MMNNIHSTDLISWLPACCCSTISNWLFCIICSNLARWRASFRCIIARSTAAFSFRSPGIYPFLVHRLVRLVLPIALPRFVVLHAKDNIFSHGTCWRPAIKQSINIRLNLRLGSRSRYCIRPTSGDHRMPRDSAPSEARKRGSEGGSPRKYDDLLTGPTKECSNENVNYSRNKFRFYGDHTCRL
jgi:hypothetical protein